MKPTLLSRSLGALALCLSLLTALFGCEPTVEPEALRVRISPEARQVITLGQQVQFTANQSVNWSVTSPGGGSVTTAGLYTAPATAGIYVVRAEATGNPANFDTASVEVRAAALPMAVSPATRPIVGVSQSFQFTANQAALWSVVSPGGGSISSAGLYTAPATPGIYVVRAASPSDPANADTASVDVRAGAPVVLSAASPRVLTGQQLTLTANTAVTWTVIDAAGGTASASTYTAPAQPGTYRLRAQSATLPSSSDTLYVRVNTASNAIAYLRTGGYIILFRHTAADVCSDNTAGGPNWWRTCNTDCGTTTARQMNATGHTDARLIGRALVATSATVDSIHTSEFCRCFVGADSIRRQLGLPTARVVQEPVLTFAAYNVENLRAEQTEQFARLRRLAAGANRVMVSQAGHNSPSGPTQLNMNTLNWGDAFVLRQRGGGQRPAFVDTVRVATWRTLGQ